MNNLAIYPFFRNWLILLLTFALFSQTNGAPRFEVSRHNYTDRIEAIWTAQIIAVLLNFPFEHQTASTVWIDQYPRPYSAAPVDDDWYYEMVAIRGFEKHGIDMTVAELGEEWKRYSCGSWGSSEQARLLLARGIKPPATGHPRYNRLWFSIGPQFSADVYGAIAPGMPNLAGKLARELCHINGYAEGVDGAVFMAGMVSLAFAEKDPKTIVRKAAQLIHPSSPYRQCLDLVIAMADDGRSFEEIAQAVEDRWHIEYPATNNAVANGGLVALCVWFGEGDFLKTINLAAQAADFTDADCNAANAAAVIGAMHGMRSLPRHLAGALNDRIQGNKMGPVTFDPAIDERITELSKRTEAVGERFILAHGGTIQGDAIVVPLQEPATQPAERFQLADLTQYWNPHWQLERAGFGGAGGGMGGIRGITYLDGEILATYPRDEVRATLLRRKSVQLADKPVLKFEAGVDPGRAWELNVYANNKLMEKRIIEGNGNTRTWETIHVDLSAFANQSVQLRLYQRVLVPNKVAGNAYWKNLRVE